MSRVLIVSLALLTAAKAIGDDREGLEFFEKKIRPVLVRECYQCHSERAKKKLRANLRLDTRSGTRMGGDSGPAVVPGDLKKSLLLSVLRHEDFEMPPDKKLPQSVIKDFERWVRLGAPDPRGGPAAKRSDIDLQKGRRFWSFQPIRRPTAPSSTSSWPQSDIDRFVLRRMQERGLTPSGDATANELLRRLHFDLTGRPPTPRQVAAFVADPSSQHYDRIVDRLLQSRHFGERWARHWLDVARFAESSGGGRTLLFEDAWRYRDYVIRSFNADKPFNRFLMEQIAGDLLPAKTDQERIDGLTGPGFLMLGPNNYELQDKELLRMEVVDEQLDTMGRAMLGLTIGCARCHDHKFDPIPTRDYYALAGIFRSTKSLLPGNVSQFVTRELPLPPEHRSAFAAYQSKIKPLKEQQARIDARIKHLASLAGVSATAKAVERSRLTGIVVDDRQAKLSPGWSTSTSVASYVELNYVYTAKNEATARFELKASAGGSYELRLSYSPSGNRATNVPVRIATRAGKSQRTVNQRKPPPIDKLFVSLGVFQVQKDESVVVEVLAKGIDGVAIVDAVQMVRPGEPSLRLEGKSKPQDIAKNKQARRDLKAAQTEKSRVARAIKKMEAKKPAVAKVMSVGEAEDAGDFFVCNRGNVHQLGSKVPRGFLRVLPHTRQPAIKTGSGRLDLAKWVASDKNPLSPRVMANRVWLHLVGRGIVATPDNFGISGQRPTHPQLLDHLAVTLISNGWSVKKLIRDIVRSRTYRLASLRTRENLTKDPANIWLAGANRRRLEAEAIRDSILIISGQLQDRLGGPSIKPGTKSEFGYRFRSNRRSVYVPVFRNSIHELFEVFDVADPNLVSGSRNVSTLPTQALFMMNSPFIREQAGFAAKRVLALPLADDSQRVEAAYQLFLQRGPTTGERQIAVRLFAASKDASQRLQQWTDLCHALFACLDFRYLK